MQDSGSSIGRVVSKEGDEIVQSDFWTITCAPMFIDHEGLPFEYDCGYVCVREIALDCIELVVVHLAD